MLVEIGVFEGILLSIMILIKMSAFELGAKKCFLLKCRLFPVIR